MPLPGAGGSGRATPKRSGGGRRPRGAPRDDKPDPYDTGQGKVLTDYDKERQQRQNRNKAKKLPKDSSPIYAPTLLADADEIDKTKKRKLGAQQRRGGRRSTINDESLG